MVRNMAPFRPTSSAARESRLAVSGCLQAYDYGNRQGVNSCNDTLLLAINPWQQGAVEGRAGEERGSSHAGDTFKVVGAAWLAVIELFGVVGRRSKTRQSGVVVAAGEVATGLTVPEASMLTRQPLGRNMRPTGSWNPEAICSSVKPGGTLTAVTAAGKPMVSSTATCSAAVIHGNRVSGDTAMVSSVSMRRCVCGVV